MRTVMFLATDVFFFFPYCSRTQHRDESNCWISVTNNRNDVLDAKGPLLDLHTVIIQKHDPTIIEKVLDERSVDGNCYDRQVVDLRYRCF